MTKGPPRHNLLAEPLHSQHQLLDGYFFARLWEPTLVILTESLVEYTLNALTAT